MPLQKTRMTKKTSIFKAEGKKVPSLGYLILPLPLRKLILQCFVMYWYETKSRRKCTCVVFIHYTTTYTCRQTWKVYKNSSLKPKTSCNLNKTKKTSVNKSSLKNEIKCSYSRENGATFPSAWEVGHVDNGLLNMATNIADENHLIRSPLLVKIRK